MTTHGTIASEDLRQMVTGGRRPRMARRLRFRGVELFRVGADLLRALALERRPAEAGDTIEWTYHTRSGGVTVTFTVPFPTRFNVPIQWRLTKHETLQGAAAARSDR